MIIPYQKGSSYLHKLDPLSKLVFILCIAVLAMTFQHSGAQACLLLFTTVVARYAAGIMWSRQWKIVRFLILFILPLFVITLLTASGSHELLRWGYFQLTVEGLDGAGSVTLRMFTLFLSSYVYIMTTDPQDLVAALTQRLKIPYRFSFGISMALTFLPLLEEEGRMISAAHQVRGRKPRGWGDKWQWWRMYMFTVLYNALRRVQQTAAAMEAKGFGAYPDRTYLRPLMSLERGRVVALLCIGITGYLWWFV